MSFCAEDIKLIIWWAVLFFYNFQTIFIYLRLKKGQNQRVETHSADVTYVSVTEVCALDGGHNLA